MSVIDVLYWTLFGCGAVCTAYLVGLFLRLAIERFRNLRRPSEELDRVRLGIDAAPHCDPATFRPYPEPVELQARSEWHDPDQPKAA